MPLPTAKPGGSGLTRSEAAIEAWKHRQRAAPKPGGLDPKIAARVKEILAGKQKKGKAKAKPKAKAPGKNTPEQKNKNRAAVAKQGGLDKLEGTIERLSVGMHSDMEKGAHDELISKGLAKRHADGSVTLSPAGKKWKSAADKGDNDAAGGALAEAQAGAGDEAAKEKDKSEKAAARETAKAERETAKGAKVAERAAKQKKQQQAAKQKAQAAAKVKAEKAKAKAGAPKKEAADPAKKQSDNRAKVARDMAEQDVGLAPAGSAALGDFADGKPLKEETAKQFEAMGLTEKGSDGQHRLTADGKAAAAAMSKGDTRAAIDAISRAADKKKQGADKAKAKGESDKAGADAKAKKDAANARLEQARIDAARSRKAIMPDTGLAIKAGARHSAGDMKHIQAAHDSTVSAGASCGPESDDSAASDTGAAETAIKGIMDNPAWYASHECSDIMQASSALQTIAMLIQSELSEEDEDDASIGQLVDAAETLVEFIQGELTELRGAAGDAADLPNSANVQTMKGIELATLDDGEEIATVSGYAVKALGDEGLVGGYLVKFGGDGDLSQFRDVFTKATNFGKHTKSDVWVHHRMLPGLGKQQLTNQAELGMDDEGVFVKHLLDLRNTYEAKLYGMVQSGKLGWSSGTAPHLVERKAIGDGRHEVTQWTLGLDASYTPMPAGGFVVNAGAVKTAFLAELGYEAIENEDREAIIPESAKADGRKADDERARKILLELDILQLEETAL